MTKKLSKGKNITIDVKRNEGFEEYYYKVFGPRWEALRESLLLPPEHVPYNTGLLKPYIMDRASILAASSLRLPTSGLILDACAAPGGKSLVLASLMNNDTKLLCNEVSSNRRRRLINVLDEHLDAEKRSQINVSGFNAASMGGKKSEQKRFDAILLDSPCSSERHIINNPNLYAKWQGGRPRYLAQRQWSLLSAAFLLLANERSLVYSTCALSPEENDGPVSRLLSKYAGEIELDMPDFVEGEVTKYGRIILPDTSGGIGPMYIARFWKL
ncbi:MAG: 16S rRNA methyltransferase [Treponema sp.]|nr:16S rRNA methyltransferase [Treponema sp.]